MRRLAAFATAGALLFSTGTGASVCHADTVGKDTSWFDYNNPQTAYIISTEAQLIGLSSLVNEEQTDKWKPARIENFEGVTFTLARDIKLTGTWTPIGKGDASYFAGTFDGNGHTISGLKVNADAENSGLFGYLGGEVRNLHVKGSVTSDHSVCGGIAGYLTSAARITECSSDVTVKGKDKTGGIVGYNDGGLVKNCMNTGNITGTHKTGGIVGENWGGRIDSCGNTGTVQSTNRGVATYGTGGVAGRSVSSTAEILESYNAGEIHSYTEATGGVVGYANARGTTVEDCYNTGSITITDKDGKEEIAAAYVGGIIGIADTNGVAVRNCYSAGSVKNADVAGGIIGLYSNENEETEQYISNNYYLKEHYDGAIGKMDDAGDPNLAGAAMDVPEGAMDSLQTSLSVAYMKDTGEYGNNGYPVLKWQQPVSEEEQALISDIPADKQKRLDRYLVRTASVIPPGQPIMNFFEPDNVMSNAFILYMEAKDKMQEHNGENEQDTAE